MAQLQRLLEDQLGRVPRLILKKSIQDELNSAGVATSDSLVEQIVSHVLSGQSTPLMWDDGTEDDRLVSLSFDADDIAAIDGKCSALLSTLPELVDEVADSTARSLLESMKRDWDDEYARQLGDYGDFRSRMEGRWGTPLGLLRMLLTISMEMGSQMPAPADAEKVLARDVLRRLHVRACQVTAEIITLLENGFADGAMARWRTLHEISIVTVLIAEHGTPLAERYVAHQAVEAKAGKEQFLLCHEELGYAPLSSEECQEIDDDFDQAIEQYGRGFRLPYGWAEGFVEKNRRGMIGLGELEAAAGRSALASHYKLASHNVHAGPHALFFRLGLIGDDVVLAGASNAGLSEPGQNTSLSLATITILGVGDPDTLDGVVAMKAVQALKLEISTAFASAEAALAADHARFQEASRE